MPDVAIHQMLKTLVPGDAISHHTLQIQKILRDAGFVSEIFVETVHPLLVKKTFSIDDYSHYSSARNILLFHFSQGTSLVKLVLKLPDRLGIIYHNITPEKYFRRVHHETWLSLIEGREQLESLVKKAEFCLADSEYNRTELVSLGAEQSGVLPIIIDFSQFDFEPHRLVQKMFAAPQTTFLFVGRLTPNKGHENLLKFFYYYKKLDPSARLLIVGQYYAFEPYLYLLNTMIRKLHLEDVWIVGHVSQAELCTYYTLADMFLCFSYHEGFCVPLIESMYFDIPILALHKTAVPDTLGDAAVQFASFDPLYMAEMAYRIKTEEDLREFIVKKQRERLKDFQFDRIKSILLDSITSLIGK